MTALFSRLARLGTLLAASSVVWGVHASDTVISVDVLVTDEAGKPVLGLRRDAFQVVADGQERPILSVTPGKKPLEMVLLLDLTASVSRTLERRVLEDDVEGALIEALQNGERLRIGSFGREMILNSGLSGDRRQLRDDLRTAFAHRRSLYGPSPLWDATQRAIESFPASGARRAIILVTDGRATGNRLSIDEVAKAAILARTSIHVVGLDLPVRVRQKETTAVVVDPGNGLEWIADVTGGRYVPAAQMGVRPAVAFAEILEALRQTYTLTFEAPALDGTFHRMQVHVRRPNLKVRARSVYTTAG